jgi:AAA domain
MAKETPRKAKLTNRQIDYCLLHMLLDSDLFTYSAEHLLPTHFSPASEMAYATIWDVALAAANNNQGKLPEQLQTVMEMDLGERLANGQKYQLSSADEKKVVDLFTFIFSFDKTKLDPDYYRTLVQDLIIERTLLDQMGRELHAANTYGRPVDIVKTLGDYHNRLSGIMVDGRGTGQTAFPLEFKPKPINKYPTSIPWFDKYMDGGQAPGEVYTLIAPTGTGKTTTGVMLCVSTARVWDDYVAKNPGAKKKISCYFTWEQSRDQVMPRFWAYAAQIDTSRLGAISDGRAELSTKGNLQPYELELFADSIAANGMENIDGEAERLRAAALELNETVRIFDYSGYDNPRDGTGGLAEVVVALKGLIKEGYEIGVVVIDYANEAVRKHMMATGKDLAHMRIMLSAFCNTCRYEIANPFQTAVWIFNQVDAAANKRPPTGEPHYTDCAECKSFSENAWFAFSYGTKDPTNNTCMLTCTKARRNRMLSPTLLKIEGNLSRMRDVSQTYSVVSELRQIVPKSLTNSRASASDLKAAVNKKRPGSSNIADY